MLFVIISEMGVDWLKHAFITKFNHVRATVYERFTDVLAKDVLAAGSLSAGRKSRTQRVNTMSFQELRADEAEPDPARSVSACGTSTGFCLNSAGCPRIARQRPGDRNACHSCKPPR